MGVFLFGDVLIYGVTVILGTMKLEKKPLEKRQTSKQKPLIKYSS